MSNEHPLADKFFRHVVLGPALKLASRLEVEGLEHVPAEGPAIIAANHLSFSDSLLLPLGARRPVAFLGKQEYFTGTGVRGMVVSSFMRSMGTIPVDRDGARAAQASLDVSEQVLSEGRLFGIYPEGTRSPDGRLYKGRTGAARLVRRTNAPVIPAGIFGTASFQPPGSRIPRPAKVRIVFGAPVDFADIDQDEKERLVLRAMTDRLMGRIQSLSSQEYVPSFATQAKAQ